ncbi:MAG: hypothetical protein COA49_05935 [Bacteroidetes bacterium]|nr:MAG: hypothetical protein COA49_05935 [Bacteroidota bacterium]
MTNNDVLRRVRYILKFDDLKMIEIFKLTDYDVDVAQLHLWLRKEEDPLLVDLSDKELAIFLNGMIIDSRGKREGPQPEPEEHLSNNLILRKLKIAFNLTSDDILDMFDSIDKHLGKHELSAFFRSPNHRSYRLCMDQYLRNFMNALQLRFG